MNAMLIVFAGKEMWYFDRMQIPLSTDCDRCSSLKNAHML